MAKSRIQESVVGSQFSALDPATSSGTVIDKSPVPGAELVDYFLFSGLIEAQSLSAVLPVIRAERPELPHPVYQLATYRIRDIQRNFPCVHLSRMVR